MENTLITSDRLSTFRTLKPFIPEGVIAEVGVYRGGSLKLLGQLYDDRAVLGFDTFEGLPKEQWIESEFHDPGDFNDTTYDEVQEFVAECPNVVLVKGLFPQSGAVFADYKFSLVHIDTDFYEGVKQSLEWFWTRMNSRGIIIFDDYDWPNCPGVQQALGEFGEPIHLAADYQAYIIKP